MTKEINAYIKNRRKELRLTQAEVAKACGVSEATVSRWESGDIANMSRSKIQALANILRVSPVALISYGEGNSVPAPAPQTSLADLYDAEILADLQRLHDDPELRMLLTASRKLSRDDIRVLADLARRMHSEE